MRGIHLIFWGIATTSTDEYGDVVLEHVRWRMDFSEDEEFTQVALSTPGAEIRARLEFSLIAGIVSDGFVGEVPFEVRGVDPIGQKTTYYSARCRIEEVGLPLWLHFEMKPSLTMSPTQLGIHWFELWLDGRRRSRYPLMLLSALPPE